MYEELAVWGLPIGLMVYVLLSCYSANERDKREQKKRDEREKEYKPFDWYRQHTKTLTKKQEEYEKKITKFKFRMKILSTVIDHFKSFPLTRPVKRTRHPIIGKKTGHNYEETEEDRLAKDVGATND